MVVPHLQRDQMRSSTCVVVISLSLCLIVSAEYTTEWAEHTTEFPEAIKPVHDAGVKTKHRLSEELYQKAYSYFKNSKAFKDYSLDDTRDLLDELDAWEAPEEVQKDFPYYLSGYDYDDRPIWVAEAGKYDPRKYIEAGPEALAVLIKYGFQAGLRALKSAHARDPARTDMRNFVLIADAEGLDLAIVTHPPSVAFGIQFGHTFRDILEKGLHSVFVLNVNYATQIAIQLARPIAGKIMERMEVLSPVKAKYKAQLRRRFPPESLPPWYGGNKSFKPIEVYG